LAKGVAIAKTTPFVPQGVPPGPLQNWQIHFPPTFLRHTRDRPAIVDRLSLGGHSRLYCLNPYRDSLVIENIIQTRTRKQTPSREDITCKPLHNITTTLSPWRTMKNDRTLPRTVTFLPMMFLFAACVTVAHGVEPGAGDRIEFNRDIRPILSNNCFYCHG